MIEAIEAAVRNMLAHVSSVERGGNRKLRDKAQNLLIQLGELRNELADREGDKEHEKRCR